MNSSQNLTTLAAAKSWVRGTTTDSDQSLTVLIGAASLAIMSALSRRSVLATTYTEVQDCRGNGSPITLNNWPVLSVSSLAVAESTIPAAAVGFGSNGYRLRAWDGQPPGSPQSIDVIGFAMRRCRQSIQVTYSAGYAVIGEAAIVDATSPDTLNYISAQPYGAWAADGGVTYADTGLPLAVTATTVTPSAGQYYVDPETGIYTFSAADDTRALLISYSYIPADLAMACNQWLGEIWAGKGRFGVLSKTLGGQETITFQRAAMSDLVKMAIQPYKRVTGV